MVIVAIVVGVIILWGIVGGVSYHGSGASSSPASASRPDCTFCVQLDNWWNSLGFWGKVAGAVWYGLQKIGCALKGC